MAKIKILHIIKSLGRGGAEMLLPETLTLHDQNKFEFHYIYFLPWKDQMVEELEKKGGLVKCISASNNLKLLLKFQDVASYCEKQNIDLIHCHLPWSGFLGRMVYKKTGIPVIYTEHNIQERYHSATKIINRISFNSQSLALGVSKDVTRSIKEHIAPKIPVQTLLNGVNTNRFKKNESNGQDIRKTYQIPVNAIVIGNIAVFREQKCIPDWLKAFKKITESTSNVYGLLVGAGPMEVQVRSMVADLGLFDKVKLAGLQSDTVSYFSAMDIFLMTSAFEGLPIALLEAMSTECAVVSTKAGGVVEVIRDNEDGLLCEVGDVSCLAAKTLFLVNNDIKRRELRNAARKRVEDLFSLAVMVDSLERIYDSQLKLN